VGRALLQDAQRGVRAVLRGRVHVNGERVKPSKVVHAGDTVEVTIATVRRTVAVTEGTERRGPASAARVGRQALCAPRRSARRRVAALRARG